MNWISDSAYANLSIDERALLLASIDVGQGEPKGKPNWGDYVRRLLAKVGLYKPAPWCAAFVSSKLIDAGVSRKDLPKNAASTYYWYEWAVATRRMMSSPTRGMLFVWFDKTGGHIGFIVKVYTMSGQVYFDTIEGNTSASGSREGTTVLRKTRSVKSLQRHKLFGFILVKGL